MTDFKIINNISEINASDEWTESLESNRVGEIVGENGEPVSSNYKGRQYRVVSIKERAYSFPERVGRGFLGVAAVVCSLGIALFYSPVWNLFTEKNTKNRYGMADLAVYNIQRHDELLNKYKCYKDEFTGGMVDPKGYPQLYDALMTGCVNIKVHHTFNEYNSDVERDIKDLVKLVPQSMNWDEGHLRCRQGLTPLYAACVNKTIPYHLIEFLLKSGANSNGTIEKNGQVHILADIESMVDSERYSEIEKLFEKYTPNLAQEPQTPNLAQEPQTANLVQEPQTANLVQEPQAPNFFKDDYKFLKEYRAYDIKIPGEFPQLYDALMTGCTRSYARSTYASYNSTIEHDIKEIVKLVPQSMSWAGGQLRCRDKLTPLYVACLNENIPVHVIKFLLESGANPNNTIETNDGPVHILAGIKEDEIDSKRYSEIEELFKKYTVKS